MGSAPRSQLFVNTETRLDEYSVIMDVWRHKHNVCLWRETIIVTQYVQMRPSGNMINVLRAVG